MPKKRTSGALVVFTHVNKKQIRVPKSVDGAVKFTPAQARKVGLKGGDVVVFSRTKAAAKKDGKRMLSSNPSSVSDVYVSDLKPLSSRFLLGR